MRYINIVYNDYWVHRRKRGGEWRLEINNIIIWVRRGFIDKTSKGIINEKGIRNNME